MEKNQLGESIAEYRKEKGLSQEKVAEYMNVSRQAVTKWESNISRPSSDNLIKLAGLFDVSVDALLGNKDAGNIMDSTKISMCRSSKVFIGLSVLCIVAYVIISSLLSVFSAGILICIFVICFPVQLFLHFYFTNAIRNNSFVGIAGFDERIEYNFVEVKKLLVRLDLHIGMISTMYIFMLCVINCIDFKLGWINALMLIIYVFDFFATILINNYRSIDKIYCNDEDKKRATRSILATIIYILLLFVGMGIIAALFEIKGIENNTMPAMRLGGVFLFGILFATIGFFVESNNIKKWHPGETKYKIDKISVICLFVCLIIFGVMCIV